MSQRNRSGRGSARNNGNNASNDHGEEVQIWESTRNGIREFVTSFNAESADLDRLVAMDKEMGATDSSKVGGARLKDMEQLCRGGVRQSDSNIQKANELIEKLKILRAVAVAKEKDEAASGPAGSGPGADRGHHQATGKRASTRDSTRDNSAAAAAAAAAAASAIYDFDAAGESPSASPGPGSQGAGSGPGAGGAGSGRKAGERASTRGAGGGGDRERDATSRERERERDRDSSLGPSKAGSVEPGVSTPGAGAGPLGNRSKVVFSKGESVAFRPKTTSGEAASDWILGEVAQVVGEGKSRRYKVLDIEPEDQSKQKEYKTSASSMIPIAPEAQAGNLPDWEPRTTVLALYPNTTTFYKAEVHSMDGERVNLKFEGENDSSTLQQVERRFVIEFRP